MKGTLHFFCGKMAAGKSTKAVEIAIDNDAILLSEDEWLRQLYPDEINVFDHSVARTSEKSIINIVRFTTPLGPMFSCATEQGVCLLEFTDRRMLETEFRDLCKKLNAVILPGSNSHLDHVQSELAEYFSGKRQTFTVPLDAPGTDFQKLVWKELQRIAYGKTRSYKQHAAVVGNPKAVRAVGSTNGQNRISILIPCHRVIASDGKLAGYGGGLHRKKWLLEFESANSQ